MVPDRLCSSCAHWRPFAHSQAGWKGRCGRWDLIMELDLCPVTQHDFSCESFKRREPQVSMIERR